MIVEPPAIEKYLAATLGVSVKLRDWDGAKRLPPILRQAYRFVQSEISGVPVVLMIDKTDDGPAPSAIARQFELALHSLEAAEGRFIPVYVRDQLSSYHRKRLVDLKVPFIIPGNQLYLPMIGLDLREHFRQLHQSRQTFSPSTQMTLLSILLEPSTPEVTPSALSHRLGYSKMTMTRVFDELEASKLIQIESRGRERCLLVPNDRKSLWHAARPFLESPVRLSLQESDDERIEAAVEEMIEGIQW